MKHEEIAERFADMWRQSRHDAGRSQEYMAKALGVSKKTIQNWEDGTSCPSQMKGFEWFEALGLQPFPYYMNLLFPETRDSEDEPSDDEINKQIWLYVTSLSKSQKQKLFYVLEGKHGSSLHGVLDMLSAYFHLPLKDRVSVAQSISTLYELDNACNELVVPGYIMPNMNNFNKAISASKEAVLQRKREYCLVGGVE